MNQCMGGYDCSEYSICIIHCLDLDGQCAVISTELVFGPQLNGPTEPYRAIYGQHTLEF